ncbi:GNAT family N-acetyltransferase [Lactiplantibacillus garii]|uniref:GNAT family N-acetyltransferase n=2 Tax=Lactiplantibacillus garii TaxID=2306423 RepID=A0A3R8J8I1_9LACO|nr:GNAT family N-acetyltransferase [Lactiplantibacillus garii]
MYHQSFADLYARYRDTATNPYCETATSVAAKVVRPGSTYWSILTGATVVGLIRVITGEAPKQARISPLLILPSFQEHHLAAAALSQIEGRYPNVHTWHVDTIAQETKLVHLYTKLGYHQILGKQTVIQPGMTVIYFEKDVN